MSSKLPLIGRILAVALGVVGVALFVLVAINGDDSAAGFVDWGGIMTVVSVVIALLSFVISLLVNPKQIKGVAIGLVLIIAVGAISYATANGADYEMYKDVTLEESKAVSAMLNAFYILGAGAVLSVVYSLVARALK